MATACWLLAGAAHAQLSEDESEADDAAFERLEAINVLRLGVLRGAGLVLVRPEAPDGVDDVNGGASLGLAVAALEKKGAAWEALRLDRAQWLGADRFELAYTLFDLQMAMFGSDQDGALCMAAVPVIALGDCVGGGVLGVRLMLLHQAHDFDSARWFHRWAELGLVLSPIGDNFDVDFVQGRMPILLGASLDHVANVTLPADEPELVLRGALGIDAVARLAGQRVELLASTRLRPALAPFRPGRDFAAEASVQLAYLWLDAWFGSLRPTAQRLFLRAAISRWQKPWLADRASHTASKTTLEAGLGLELTARGVTPE
jgi:hypothetical protein